MKRALLTLAVAVALAAGVAVAPAGADDPIGPSAGCPNPAGGPVEWQLKQYKVGADVAQVDRNDDGHVCVLRINDAAPVHGVGAIDNRVPIPPGVGLPG